MHVPAYLTTGSTYGGPYGATHGDYTLGTGLAGRPVTVADLRKWLVPSPNHGGRNGHTSETTIAIHCGEVFRPGL